MERPFYKLQYVENITFDMKKFDYHDILEFIGAYPDHLLYFGSRDGKEGNLVGYGDGANKFIYHKAAEQMCAVNEILTKRDNYFVDINSEHKFWKSKDNIKNFTTFIGMMISFGVLFPYHFSPSFLHYLTGDILDENDLLFYLQIIDPDMVKQMKKINKEDFYETTDFQSAYDFMYDHLIYKNNLVPQSIYLHISYLLENNSNFMNFTIQEIDRYLSGSYEINSKEVCKLMIFDEKDKKYCKMFYDFIKKLNQTQIRNMLIAFGGSLSMDKTFRIKVTDEIEEDIQLQTCYKTVDINKKLFKKESTLKLLGGYFTNTDNGLFDEDENQSNNNSEENSGENYMMEVTIEIDQNGNMGFSIVDINEDSSSDDDDFSFSDSNNINSINSDVGLGIFSMFGNI